MATKTGNGQLAMGHGAEAGADFDRLRAQVAVLVGRIEKIEAQPRISAADFGTVASELRQLDHKLGVLERFTHGYAGQTTEKVEAVEKDLHVRLQRDLAAEHREDEALEGLGKQVAVLVERVDELEAARVVHGRAIGSNTNRIDGLERLTQTAVVATEPVGQDVLDTLAEFQGSKASIVEGSGPALSATNPPVAGAGPSGPAPAVSLSPSAAHGPSAERSSAPSIDPDAAHAWLMERSKAHVASGLATADCKRVAALEHLERETTGWGGGVGEVWARLLAVGRLLQMWHDDVPSHEYQARVAGLGLDALGFERFDILGVESRLREQWRAFEAGDRVPGLARLRMDDGAVAQGGAA